jgi:hypothetical protein
MYSTETDPGDRFIGEMRKVAPSGAVGVQMRSWSLDVVPKAQLSCERGERG